MAGMRVYSPNPANGFQWAVPEDPGDFDRLRAAAEMVGAGGPWEPVQVKLLEREKRNAPLLKHADSPWLSDPVLVLTAGAREKMEAFLRPWGAILPLKCVSEPLDVFVPTNLVDGLDRSHTVGKMFRDEPDRYMFINAYGFHADAIRNESIFSIPERRRQCLFVQEEFVDRWVAAGLTGIEFTLVWAEDPADPGPFYSEIASYRPSGAGRVYP